VREIAGFSGSAPLSAKDLPIEAPKTLAALRDAEAKCTRCPLYKSATQVVPGEGPQRADLVRAKKLSGQNEKSI